MTDQDPQMTASSAKPTGELSKFALGLMMGGFIGVLSGCVVGVQMAQTDAVNTGSGPPVAPPPTTPTAPASGAGPHVSPAPSAAVSPSVVVGRPRSEYGYVTYPITFTNSTGRDLGYVEVNCVFYDASGQLIGTESETWTQVTAGETVSGQLLTNDFRLSEVERYECRPRGG